MSEASRLDELHDLISWNTLSAIQLPERGLLREIARADAAQDLRLKDKSVDHYYGTDLSSLPSLGDDLSDFGQWPSVASTLWNKLINMTGFDPSNVDYDGSVFSAFKTKFSTSPYWNGLEFNIQYRDATLRVRDYSEMVGAVIDLVRVGVSGDIRAGLIESIKKIAELASRNVRTQVKDTLAQNSTLTVYQGKLYVFFLYGTVSMTARQGKYTVIDQAMRVVRGYGVLDFDFCKRHADRIHAYEFKNLDDWDHMGAADPVPPNDNDSWPPD
jgi:hypothetical protein